ncbi:hypothetical protein Tco_0861484 [Tanacetum coccineum]|uniref:Uncharacterized protein n=1 Tax=Tanacetum coccineum TaxID=301880 RepID=A0ABQ5BKX6_9ASTR
MHSESASGHDALAASTAEADPRKIDPNDLVSKQQVIVKGTKNFSFDHIIVGTNPHVLVDKSIYVSEGLETVLTKLATEKEVSKAEKEVSFRYEFNTSPDLFSSDDALNDIKLEELSKLVQNVEVDFMDLDSPEDDALIIIQDEDKREVHTKKLVYEKEEAETKVLLLKAKPASQIWNNSPASGKSLQPETAKIRTLDSLPSLLLKVTKALNRPTDSMVESSKKKKLKKFDFVTERVCKKKIVRSLTTDFNLGYLYIQIDEDYWSVLEPFSLSVDLNIKSPKCKLAEEKFSRVSLKTV